jgi:hypothetical protein
MSSTGIDAINSGPLIFRTYNDNSQNNSYVLGNYDIPISSNYILTTSTGGMIVPSNNINISSITVSSITASSITASSITASSITASTINASTITTNNCNASSITVSSINGSVYPPIIGAAFKAMPVIFTTNSETIQADNPGLYLVINNYTNCKIELTSFTNSPANLGNTYVFLLPSTTTQDTSILVDLSPPSLTYLLPSTLSATTGINKWNTLYYISSSGNGITDVAYEFY